MMSDDQHPETKTVFRQKNKTFYVGLLSFLAIGCVQQPEPVAPPPTTPNTMEITIDQMGNIPLNGVTAGGRPILPVSGHPVTRQRTYNFGPTVATGNVCFWDTQYPQKKYCWTNTGSAEISINRNGIIQLAKFGSAPIPPQMVNATVTKQSYSGPGSYCFWTSLGFIYCF